MKSSTLNTLLVAKAIFNKTKPLVSAGDKHSCTAGIILLQDFVELVVLAVLDEVDINETKNIESKSFDELLGELKKNKIKVIKSGTIKALNKQRVIAKHYGQLTEPTSVVNYFTTAICFTNSLLKDVVGRTLDEILVADVLNEGVTKELVETAIEKAENAKFLDALEYLRRSFYLAYEYQYSIYGYRIYDTPPMGLMGLGGQKAPYWTKNKAWISANVRSPLDYVQINHEQLKSDCIEWGVSTASVENFRRLTPRVVETEHNCWHLDYTTSYVANELNSENFNFCLDILLDFLLKKQEFESSHKWPKTENTIPAPPIYVGKNIYQNASTESNVIGLVQANYFYDVQRVVTGFNTEERYLYVHLYPQGGNATYDQHIYGYLLAEAIKS
ncbi:hypothetical protein ACTBAC_004533 [Vibrio parahaemolyticus]|nr:hypothetical protein [Vibrio parahaemolyticus]AKU54771.1 hypothetical protein FORC8_1211 [Vibrio parahaemolyticus]APE83827.1 hypothetical protein FORC18_1214 [Vibrio parahaemolyticus]EGU9323592.1 hypothetical protein [Vibrio parahaemolyticus]TOM93587.1 hypothetical protein CGH66_25115 [Vibrio parahaemolyticus]TON28638.1 hypothetical protein CGH59_24910 [Vibrio parahaemolyticus]